MRRLASSALASAIALIGCSSSLKAEEVLQYVVNVTGNGYSERTLELFKQTSNSSGSSFTLTKISTTPLSGSTPESTYFNPSENKIYIIDETDNKLHSYDITNDSWTRDITLNTESLDVDPAYATVNIQSSSVVTNTSNISTNTSNISSNDTDISTNASDISTNASNITTNKNNINTLGEGVANATALTAALTALPQVSIDSKLSCGIGTGTYSSSYALGFGCASKVNEKLNVNFGGSYVGGGSKDYGSGTLDTVAAKAGFVFKLGKITKPPLISMKEKKELKTEVKNLKSTNQELKNLLALQNQRLEKLEQIALGSFNSKELVSSLQ